MGIKEIIALVPAFFKFWDQIVSLIKILQKTPEEKHQEIMQKIQKEADAYAQPGSRPKWE